MRKKRRIKKWTFFLTIIFILGLIYSGFKIVLWKFSVDKNNDIKKELEKSVTVIDDDFERKYMVDFDNLKSQNSDTVAYIKINNTDISYVVVKGNDNSYYLNHSFNREYNVAGWIFADYRNRFDKTDKNIILYGHSMKDKSMFGSLYKVFSNEWLSDRTNYDIVFVTSDEESIYRVFSTYYVKVEDYYITTDFINDDQFEKFVNVLKSRSSWDFNVDVSSSDSILTLSTCTSDNNRLVLHAKKL